MDLAPDSILHFSPAPGAVKFSHPEKDHARVLDHALWNVRLVGWATVVVADGITRLEAVVLYENRSPLLLSSYLEHLCAVTGLSVTGMDWRIEQSTGGAR